MWLVAPADTCLIGDPCLSAWVKWVKLFIMNSSSQYNNVLGVMIDVNVFVCFTHLNIEELIIACSTWYIHFIKFFAKRRTEPWKRPIAHFMVRPSSYTAFVCLGFKYFTRWSIHFERANKRKAIPGRFQSKEYHI